MKEYELTYYNDKKGRNFTRHFKTFKEAYEHALKLGLHEFNIDGTDYYHID